MSVSGDGPAGSDLRTLAIEFQGTMDPVDQLVSEVNIGAEAHTLRGRLVELARVLGRRPDLTALPGIVLRAYSEVTDALGGIQQGREAIRHVTFERLQKGHAKLSQVAHVTESATLELMNGIDRSLGLIDQLAAVVPDHPTAATAIDSLRDELNEFFGHLQFQDITAQQLAGVGGLLEDIETRVQSVVTRFDGRAVTAAVGDGKGQLTGAYNADATFDRISARQAAIDAAFTRTGAQASR